MRAAFEFSLWTADPQDPPPGLFRGKWLSSPCISRSQLRLQALAWWTTSLGQATLRGSLPGT
jgi:hypothetical protein